jgi:phage-related protein
MYGSGLVTVGTQVVSFFKNNELAGDALKGVIAGVAAGLLAFAITAIPDAILGLTAMATATWGAIAPMLVMAAPFIAIGIVVAVVVTGIILAFQHWGQITAWFKGLWAAVSSWFMGLMGTLGAFFTGVWKGIQTGLQNAWNFIVNVVKIGGELLFLAVFGPILQIVGAFEWLYNHNYYFKALVDTIVNFFKMLFSWLVDGWNTFIKGLIITWNNLVSFAVMIWTQVSGAIQTGFSIAIGFIQGVWTTISTVFSNAWSTYISGPLAAMWSAVSTFFSGIWTNYIAKPISSLWTSISTTIGGWVTKAVEWGGNLIQGFVNGIVAKASSVAGAVGGIAGQVLAFLGFHSPTKLGPGSEADQWAPNFVKMYAKGLTNGLPEIQKAMNGLALPLAMNFNSSGSYAAMSGARIAAASGGNQTIIVQSPDIYMDHRKVTDTVAQRMVDKTRAKGGVRAH